MRLKRGRGRSSTGKYLIFKEIMENMGDMEKECLVVGGTELEQIRRRMTSSARLDASPPHKRFLM